MESLTLLACSMLQRILETGLVNPLMSAEIAGALLLLKANLA